MRSSLVFSLSRIFYFSRAPFRRLATPLQFESFASKESEDLDAAKAKVFDRERETFSR